MNIYETTKLVDEYLLFHYASAEEILPWDFGPKQALNFAQRTVSELLDTATVPDQASALDLGCAVGRSCYELAKSASQVIGIDYSAAFINSARHIRDQGELNYLRAEEGRQSSQLTARLPEQAATQRVEFQTGDAMQLPATLGSFDIVHAANLLCRLTQPQLLLQRLPQLVKPGGQLLLTTPCTWLEEFTPSENWPTGSTRQWLHDTLSKDFTLKTTRDMPFLIREHARKFQWSVALGMRWRRRQSNEP